MESQRNRRAARRHKPKRSTKVVCLKGAFGLGRNMALALLDVSETGTRLLIKESLAPGQEVEITFESMALYRPVKRSGAVVWCVAAQDGTFAVGVRFEKFLGFSDWQALTTTE